MMKMMKQIFLVALLAVAMVGTSAAAKTKNLRRDLQDGQTLQDNIQTVLACVSNTVTNDPATTIDANDFLTCATNALQTMMGQGGDATNADPAAAMTDLLDCMGEAVGCDVQQLLDGITNNNGGGAGAGNGGNGGVLGWLGGFFGGGGRRH